MAREHDLKIDVQPMDDLLSGDKTGEIRNDDRGFEVGDIVRLTCIDGRIADRRISHIQRGYGLPEGICVLSYSPTPVAPVSPDATGKCGELVTVAWFQPSQRCCDNGWMEAMAWQEGEFSAPVVLRSQAEELLAAERAKRHEADLAFQLEYQSHELTKRERDALQADNAAKGEQERIRFEGDLDKWIKIIGAGITGYQPEAYSMMDLACDELVKLRAKCEVVEQALETLLKLNDDSGPFGGEMYQDRVDRAWDVARAALGGKPS
nr:DUF3850 domain-containing protein [Brucella intermedia]